MRTSQTVSARNPVGVANLVAKLCNIRGWPGPIARRDFGVPSLHVYATKFNDRRLGTPRSCHFMWAEDDGQCSTILCAHFAPLVQAGHKFEHVTLIVNSISVLALRMMEQLTIHVEMLSVLDLSVDRLSHRFVPRYEFLTEPEIVAAEKQYGPRATWNKIIATHSKTPDIIARLLGMVVGDVVRVRRFIPASGVSVIYRVAV